MGSKNERSDAFLCVGGWSEGETSSVKKMKVCEGTLGKAGENVTKQM